VRASFSAVAVRDTVLPPVPSGCVPATCASVELYCGIASDGCGHYVDCGECAVEWSIDLNQYVWALAVESGVYEPSYTWAVVSPTSRDAAQSLVLLGSGALVEIARWPLAHRVRDIVLSNDPDQTRLYVSHVDSPDIDVVDTHTYRFGSFSLGDAPVAPALGSASLVAERIAMVPGRPDRLAAYIELPGGTFDDGMGGHVTRAARPLGLALYDTTTGQRVFTPTPVPVESPVRRLIPGEADGVLYAGLDEPELLRRYDIVGDAVRAGMDGHPNSFVDRSALRWVGATVFGHYLLDAAGVLVDLEGVEPDRLLPHTIGATARERGQARLFSVSQHSVAHDPATFEIVSRLGPVFSPDLGVSSDTIDDDVAVEAVVARGTSTILHMRGGIESSGYPFIEHDADPPWLLRRVQSNFFWSETER